jgi:spermidine/putrescine ABC transporter ATP-binding subunit
VSEPVDRDTAPDTGEKDVARRVAKDTVIDGVRKQFGDVVAVADFSLEVPGGEFLTLLGPSGCGKTTLLRMIAGLEDVSAGRILIDGGDVTQVPANRRDTSIMFQNYALFPHKTVIDNIAFGLKVRGVPRAERERRARELLDFIHLPDVGHRRPGQLSGGQSQRVALARSLVIQPAILLLDEPLGALDANLRRHMQLELKRIQRQVGITFIYVTHDQEEALTMSDRIVVMRSGRVEQIGPPDEIYNTPRSEFVANFIGHCNVLSVVVSATDGDRAICENPDLGRMSVSNPNQVPVKPGDQVGIAVRPERIRVGEAALSTEMQAVVRYRDSMFLGATHRLIIDAGTSGEMNVEVRDPLPLSEGDKIQIGWNASDALVLHH